MVPCFMFMLLAKKTDPGWLHNAGRRRVSRLHYASSNRSYVIPSAVEGRHKCGIRHPSRRGPSTSLRMTDCVNGLHSFVLHGPRMVAHPG